MSLPRAAAFALALAPAACNGGDSDPYIVCFRVGDDKFATLQEAVDAADDGDTVHICEDVVIDGARVVGKSIILRGGGRDQSFLSVQGEQAGIVAVDADVTVWDLGLRSEGGSAIRAERGKLTLDAVDLLGGGFVTLDSEEAEIVATDILVKNEDGNGCIKMVGGTLDLRDSDVARCNSYGVSLTQRARAKLVGNRFDQISYTNGAGYLFEADGTAIVATDLAIVETEGNTFEQVGVAAVQVEASTLSMQGDVIDTTFVGVLTLGSDVKLRDLSITAVQGYGAYLRTSVVTAENLEILGDDASGYGVYAPGTTMTLTGAVVSDFGSGGVVGSSLSTTAVGEITLDDVGVDNVGELGVAIIDGSLDANNVRVSGVYDPSGTCVDPTNGDVCNFAVVTGNGSLTWIGGSVHDNEGFGFVARGGRLEISDTTVTNHPRASVDGDTAAVVLQRVTIDGSGEYGVRVVDSDTALADVTITNGDGATTEAFDLGDGVYTVVTLDSGVDVSVLRGSLDAARLVLGPSDVGVDAQDASVELRDVTMTSIHHAAVTARSGDLSLVGATITDVGAPAIRGTDAALALFDVALSGATTWERVELGYLDGVAVDEVRELQHEPAIRTSGGSLTAEDASVAGADGPALATVDTVCELDGVDASAVARIADPTRAAVDLAWAFTTPTALVSNLEVDGAATGDGLRVTAIPDVNAVVELIDAKVADVAGVGITLTGVVGTVTGIDVDGAGGAGVLVRGGDLVLTGEDGARDGRIVGARAAGLVAEDATLAVIDLTVVSPAASGVDVRGGAVTFAGVTVEEAAAWGLACDATAPTAVATCDAALDGALGRVDTDCGSVCKP